MDKKKWKIAISLFFLTFPLVLIYQAVENYLIWRESRDPWDLAGTIINLCLILIFLYHYLLVIRKNKKKDKENEERINNINHGNVWLCLALLFLIVTIIYITVNIYKIVIT